MAVRDSDDFDFAGIVVAAGLASLLAGADLVSPPVLFVSAGVVFVSPAADSFLAPAL